LLSTFGTTLGEVALQPSTGGAFIISLYSSGPPKEDGINVYHNVIWDRKADGGFPGMFSHCTYIRIAGNHCFCDFIWLDTFSVFPSNTHLRMNQVKRALSYKAQKLILTLQNEFSVTASLDVRKLNIAISNTETKELKRRVRDIIDPGRNLGHVDVKKSVPATEADISEHERKEANGEHDAFKDNNPISKTLDEQDIRRPRAISDVQNPGQEQERKFTPQDVDERDMNKDGLKAGVKRNPDGSICQDCN
jgi:predicted Rdx family selenoprotein